MISFFFNKERKITSSLISILQPIEIDAFFEEHQNLIERLEIAYSDQTSWLSQIVPCLKQLAQMVARLPYKPNGIFSGESDLFRASVTAATYAIEVMESSVQLEKNIMAQHLLQSRLKACATLAGLCSWLDVFNRIEIRELPRNIHSSFFHISEANHIQSIPFNPLALPYNTWVTEKLRQNPALQLQLGWNSASPITQTQQNLRLFLARHILLPKTLAWLSEAGPLPILELMKCLTTDTDIEHLPSAVVKARDLGLYRTCLLERERMGAKLGAILAPEGWQETLIRILRTRILNDWEINAKDSPLRKGADGLFLFWPDVCPILIEDMKHFGLVDLPTDPDIWAGCLLSSGITLPSRNKTATCLIAVTPNARPREAIKLSDAYFFSSGRTLYAKTIKRDFEVELPFDQSTALSRLTREAMELSDNAFTDTLPEKVQPKPMFVWQLTAEFEQEEFQNALNSLLTSLTLQPKVSTDLVIDEGLFLPQDFFRTIQTELSFERFVLAALTSNCLYQTKYNEPLWVTHADSNGHLFRGVILKPNLFEGVIDHQKLTFNDIFKHFHKKEAQPRFAFKQMSAESSDQLSFDFEEAIND